MGTELVYTQWLQGSAHIGWVQATHTGYRPGQDRISLHTMDPGICTHRLGAGYTHWLQTWTGQDKFYTQWIQGSAHIGWCRLHTLVTDLDWYRVSLHTMAPGVCTHRLGAGYTHWVQTWTGQDKFTHIGSRDLHTSAGCWLHTLVTDLDMTG